LRLPINTLPDEELSRLGLKRLGQAQTQADAVNLAENALGEAFLGIVILQRCNVDERKFYAVWAKPNPSNADSTKATHAKAGG
jgi:hypothetical protein